MSLPADPSSPANVWCETCNQSLAASRAPAHLASKKHAENLRKTQILATTSAPAESEQGAAPKRAAKASSKREAAVEERPSTPPAESKRSAGRAPSEPAGGQGVAAKPKPSGTTRRAAKPTSKSAAPPSDEDDSASASDDAERPARRPAPAKKVGGLAPDPNRDGYYWCGICEVSLAPGPADSHPGTKRHQDKAAKYLEAGVRNMKLSSRG